MCQYIGIDDEPDQPTTAPTFVKACFVSSPITTKRISGNPPAFLVSRVNELSGSVARYLSGRHSVPKGVRDEADGAITGDPEDEI